MTQSPLNAPQKPPKDLEGLEGHDNPQKRLSGQKNAPRTPLRKRPDGVRGAAKQIREFCLECVGGSSALVKTCAGYRCPLWSWRFGKDPAYVKDGNLLDPSKVRKMNQKEKKK